ncbi:MAG: Mobile element protein [Candidatus Fermentimicrarchaeum limneticum]|uniref:Mobile element protein n=1 Tax=Fermentimicrarchaeum limneticum TaxID=2795018 RepID=A0A7D5XFX2_FERL1|nr:MAG: Mobile element protein [Candidatus Fermentimicrarchaeum limneticum]
MRAYRFRIYPSKKQEELLNKHLWLAKELWNELLEHCKQTYEDFGYFPTKNTLQLMVKNYGLYSQTQQETAHRVYNAVINVFKMRKKGVKRGFPRFKSFDRMKSLNYPQSGFWLEKKLKITPFGELTIKKHREVKGRIKTLTLKREASGKWFAIFCVETPKEIPKENKGEAVGIDLGLKTFATLSDGEVINNPRHFKRYEERLALVQRELSKKKKRSTNRKRAKIRVAKLYEKVADCRRDFLHKISTELVNDYSIIVLEKLASQEMSEENYGKQINDAGWNMFANMLAYKAEGAGCSVVFVNPKNTSKMCSRCRNVRNDLTLQDRTYACPECGLSTDRDLNAARNILTRATPGQGGSNACNSLLERDAAEAASMKQEAHILYGWEHVTKPTP